MSNKLKDNDWGQLGSLMTNDDRQNILKLYADLNTKNEFEIMFYNYNETSMNYNKYRTVLAYIQQRAKSQKLEIITMSVLDIIYGPEDSDTSYRITIDNIDNINKYMRMLHQHKNHVIFRVLCAMLIEGNKDMTIMRKVKDRENVVDLNDFDLRIRKADELDVSKKELKSLSEMTEVERDRITFRFKERVSLFDKN